MPEFDYFVIFAEMRTGSNLLEANLELFDEFTVHGEAFNPHFIGYPNKTELLGMTMAQRDSEPMALIEAVKSSADVVGGFRYFHDHDPRVLEPLLDDPRCAKIILTRNPLESYVSRKIAQATGQWKLTNADRRKEALAEFDVAEFEALVRELQAFQVKLLNGLQERGQTAFYVAYDDVQDIKVINGLAKWLGAQSSLSEFGHKMKPQNPGALKEKVANPEAMERALSRQDWFNLSRTPNFEPRRGVAAPSYVAATQTPLLYMPVRSGPDDTVLSWLAALDGTTVDSLTTDFTQKQLRSWLTDRPGNRRFTVLRHPLARAHHVFCSRILAKGPGTFGRIRQMLRNRHGLPIPEQAPAADYSLDQHKACFLGFLSFVKMNLNGQTNLRIDPHWSSQTVMLEGMSRLAPPDFVLREEDMVFYLPALAQQVGHDDPPDPAQPRSQDVPFALDDVYDQDLEAACREAYSRDYRMLGFADWRPSRHR